MRLTTRQTGIISYAGIGEKTLWDAAKRVLTEESPVPERFRTFLPVFPAELIVNMRYIGRGTGASPEGFSTDEKEYHARLSTEQPKLYTGFNRSRNFDENGQFTGGGTVTVDEIWAARFPQYQPFLGEKLCVYMIGGGHQAVAVPQSIYPRTALLERFERELGIRERCADYAAFVRERLRSGEPYDPAHLEEAYLREYEPENTAVSQHDLSRVMQDLALARNVNGSEPQTFFLFTENGKRAEGIPQYVPFLYACDLFEEVPVTRHNARLVQLGYAGAEEVGDFWLPCEDVLAYRNKMTGCLDMAALCEGFQIAPAPTADGAAYPDTARVACITDRSLTVYEAKTVNNPAYGSGIGPNGMLNRRVYLPGGDALMTEGVLVWEEPIPCENTVLLPGQCAHMLTAAEKQEYKGRLVDALFRREGVLGQLEPGSKAYEEARAPLDACVDRLRKLCMECGEAIGQMSSYDADIDYLIRMGLAREASSEDAEPVRFAPDARREQTIESGFAMRSRLRSVPAQTLYTRQFHQKTVCEAEEEIPKQETADLPVPSAEEFLSAVSAELIRSADTESLPEPPKPEGGKAPKKSLAASSAKGKASAEKKKTKKTKEKKVGSIRFEQLGLDDLFFSVTETGEESKPEESVSQNT